MKDLHTLEKTTWEQIKVGEVFAYAGCWQIHEKTSSHGCRVLAYDYEEDEKHIGVHRDDNTKDTHYLSDPWYVFFGSDLYKLPLSVQKLWKN